ncbi:MAG: hypothetical protein ACOCRX_08005, partial [Candidatus Woesearchaeota archaeon]
MEFKKFNSKLQNHFAKMTALSESLFEVNLDKDKLWELYLDSFPPGTNKIFRERRYYDCSCCRHFIKSIGNVVSIKDGNIISLWDFNAGDNVFQTVIDELSKFVKSHIISDFYISSFKKIGTEKNYEQLENGNINTYHHLYLELPDRFVNRGGRSLGDIKGSLRTNRDVFKRSLDEISEDSILTILEIIS